MKAKHLLSLKELGHDQITELLRQAQIFADPFAQRNDFRRRLAGKAICNLFFEPSTRTRSSFELAGKRLGADVLNFEGSSSSLKKGETALDTFKTLEAMGVDVFVIRHAEDGAVAQLAEHAKPTTRVINAGDGRSAHPTQGLLDMLTIRQNTRKEFQSLSVLLVGDIRHSRVARSDLQALHTLGVNDLRVCGPKSLMPDASELFSAPVFDSFDQAIEGVDVVIMLRLQRERMEEGLVDSLETYYQEWGLDTRRLAMASKDAIVMHPGPMNRGVEIAADVADGRQSVILQQVANGVAMRMAVLAAFS